MSDHKNKPTQEKKASEKSDELEELQIFINKKKIQNVALKKIIAKLNTEENHTNKK